MSDNRIFNVNGKGDDLLLATLWLAFRQAGYSTAKAWRVDPVKGMILLWYATETDTPFPAPMGADEVYHVVRQWLLSKPQAECVGWDADADHDGSNSLGWRVYCEDWGHVGDDHYAIVAVKPAWMWYGK
jgi:hypothetical protein